VIEFDGGISEDVYSISAKNSHSEQSDRCRLSTDSRARQSRDPFDLPDAL
jgi:hypothetical protein